MFLGRHGGGWQVFSNDGEIVEQDGGIFPDEWHQKNFIESIRSRKQPNGDVEQGHLSATLIHLGNIAYRVGNKQLFFDVEDERFVDNEKANQLIKSSYRENYRIEEFE
ncbi:MAG: hypothetical protein HOA90_12885 [Prolixibacteraceae bacterium]|nr:hypothetical protein [Prolixibacteraceae bacterium]